MRWRPATSSRWCSALEATYQRPHAAQWVNFLRSHDELDLGRLTAAQRQQVFEAFGPTKDMQLYDRGIRRRLAPMLDNDRRRLELAFSLLFTLPGTPMLQYGDEIGIGDDLSLPERECARTPMQWSGDRNGGFSTAAADGAAGDLAIRSTATSGSTSRRSGAIRTRCSTGSSARSACGEECPEISWGDWKILDAGRAGRAGDALRLATTTR